MKDLKEIESFTFASTASRRLRMILAHKVKVILATRSWHLPPGRAETADEMGINGGLESQGLHVKSPPVYQRGGLNNQLHGCLNVLSLGQGLNDIGPVKDDKGS